MGQEWLMLHPIHFLDLSHRNRTVSAFAGYSAHIGPNCPNGSFPGARGQSELQHAKFPYRIQCNLSWPHCISTGEFALDKAKHMGKKYWISSPQNLGKKPL